MFKVDEAIKVIRETSVIYIRINNKMIMNRFCLKSGHELDSCLSLTIISEGR